MKKFFCLTVILLSASVSFGTIWLPAIISDNMVLQADSNAPLWGKASPNSEVKILSSWNKKTVTASTDEQGKWFANLYTTKAGKKGKIIITCNKETRTISNVLVGEVWLCSGQSNMAFELNQINDPNREIKKAKYPKIRLFKVKKTTAQTPQEDCFGEWLECSPESAAQFSAVGYFFGKTLYAKIHKPIGLIDSSFGGTPAQAWTSMDAMTNNPLLREYVEIDTINESNKQKFEMQYAEQLKEWKNKVMKAVADGKPAPKKPPQPNELREHRKCGRLYNAMIRPLMPFAIKGVIWYQGEYNDDNPIGYRTLFPTLITDWRQNWGQGDFSFYFVQLAGYDHTRSRSAWPLLREAQTMTLALPNTGMAVAMDVGDANDIHPKNKQAVGKRLALWALAKNYGKKLTYSGPLYKAMNIEGDKIRITFDYANGRLKLPKKSETLKGFVIAGQDKNFVSANAKIERNSVLVWSDEVKNPVAVRYGWAGWSQCNLYNKYDLPASPFRTDNE